MKILILTGQLYPVPGNNTNLICKLIDGLRQHHSVCLASAAFDRSNMTLPETIHNCPVYWILDSRTDIRRKFIYPAVSKIVDQNGYSDAIQSLIIARRLREIHKDYPYDLIISTMEPYCSACAALLIPSDIKRVLYLMDPPNCVCNEQGETGFRRRILPEILKRHDFILTTPFIHEALINHGICLDNDRIIEVGFPMIHHHAYIADENDVHMDQSKINLLFCGWLYSDIRSPKYFLDIASRLDERFCIYFMGKECDKLRERFDFDTKAQVITLPQQPYQVALNAMADADVLINIGNSVPVHMPSKTLEYINTGKPIVNFHKLTDCPTLHYTSRYPLCLNLWEGETLTENIIDAFIRFCADNKGRTVGTSNLVKQFPDCTPEYISNLILEKFGANYD